ncbi:MAG: hypothetical protein IK115_11665 [Lachnospiraceae bacterium]|nr:hypothetical protein [Lachnospiraceae bacterium]
MKKRASLTALILLLILSACGNKEEDASPLAATNKMREVVPGTAADPTESDPGPAVSAEPEQAYDIESIFTEEAFCRIMDGEETAVCVLYGLGGEGGYVTSSTDDPEIIADFIDAFRALTIKNIITDPDEMGYVADGGEDFVFGLENGSQVNLTMDGGTRIHADEVVYELDNTGKLNELCAMMLEMTYLNEAGGLPEDGYIAILHGGVGERTYETYVYEYFQGYKYINVESTTLSYGSTQWTHKVTRTGKLASRQEVLEQAEAHGAGSFVTFPEDTEAHPVEAFLK